MSGPLAALEASLRDSPPRTIPGADEWSRAAVAAVFATGPGAPELLYILRSRQAGDPWSGQVAFPGGRAEPGDATLVDTAARETFEELGLDLVGDPGCRLLGPLDEIQARTRGRVLPLVIRPHAFVLGGGASRELRRNVEVASAFWVPLPWLTDPARATEHEARSGDLRWRLPAIDLGPGLVLWGLTHRMTLDLLERLGHSTR